MDYPIEVKPKHTESPVHYFLLGSVISTLWFLLWYFCKPEPKFETMFKYVLYILGFFMIHALLCVLVRIPVFRKLKRSFICFSKPVYCTGDTVEFILFDPSSEMDLDKVKLNLSEVRLGKAFRSIYKKVSPIAFREAESEGRHVFVGSFVIPDGLEAQSAFKDGDDITLAIQLKYLVSDVYFEIPLENRPF